jgi:glycosyltransferase involved in cell wall biosynthesis
LLRAVHAAHHSTLRPAPPSAPPPSDTVSAVRALVISNMLPDAAHPERGQFVRDQVAQLARIEGIEVRLHELAPGPRALARGALELRRRYRRERFDVVHAHFGLTAWPAFAVPARVRALTVHGTDVCHPRTRRLTLMAGARMDLLAVASAPLAEQLSRGSGTRAQVLPCGVDTDRFRPIPRSEASMRLGMDPERPFVLFAADPARPEKRYDRALALANATGAQLHTLGGVAPERVPDLVNAAKAVLVPSAREGFGLAVLEALACDVPVLATPVGVHPEALRGLPGTLCAPFALEVWREALAPHLRERDPRIAGRERADRYSARRMAERVAAAWRAALGDGG